MQISLHACRIVWLATELCHEKVLLSGQTLMWWLICFALLRDAQKRECRRVCVCEAECMCDDSLGSVLVCAALNWLMKLENEARAVSAIIGQRPRLVEETRQSQGFHYSGYICMYVSVCALCIHMCRLHICVCRADEKHEKKEPVKCRTDRHSCESWAATSLTISVCVSHSWCFLSIYLSFPPPCSGTSKP